MIRLVTRALLCLALLGCSPSVAPTSPDGPSGASAAPSSAGTPPALVAASNAFSSDLETVAAAYLALVTDSNLVFYEIQAEFAAAGDEPTKLGAAFAKSVAWGEDFIVRIDQLSFPKEVQPQVTALRASVQAVANIERRLAGTPSNQALLAQADAAYELQAVAASEMRRVLALPPLTAVETVAPTARAGPKRYMPGDTITVTSDNSPTLEITVTKVKVAKSYPGTFGGDKPQLAGNVFIQAWLTYRSLADGASYNSFDWQVFADDTAVPGFTFLLDGPEPELGSGVLPKGRKASGWVVYEVPAQGEVVLSYGSAMSFTDEAPLFEVTLRK